MRLQGCPDLGPDVKPATLNNVINVGSCGTSERNYEFDRCPGFWLRRLHHGYNKDECSTLGLSPESAFDVTWRSHFAYKAGHSIGDPPPPKLVQAIRFMEAQLRAKEALHAQRVREDNEKKQIKSRHPGAKIVARGK